MMNLNNAWKVIEGITMFQEIIETIVLIVEVGDLFQRDVSGKAEVLFGCIGNVWAVFPKFTNIFIK